MFKTLKNAFKVKEIRVKIFITLALLLVYRLGCWLPIPGINVESFSSQVTGDFLTLLSSLSGGALSNGAFLALGVGPYISASIVVQLLGFVIPALERLTKHGGEDGRKKINQITKIAGLVLALAQSIAIVVSFGNNGALNTSFFGANTPTWVAGAFVVAMLVAGAMFTFWLGEKITELGVGNGLSLLIFVGILSSAGTSMGSVVKAIIDGKVSEVWNLLIFIATLIIIFALIVFIDLSERKIPVQYAKQIKGRKMYGGQSTFIPVKLLGTGVMPIIFATSFITFPQLIASFWPTSAFYQWYSKWLGAGSWVYSIVVGLFILFFAYFWNQMMFNPEDISRQIQQNGGFVTGYRAGKQTADYLKKVSTRVTLFGALFLAFLTIVPSIVFKAIGGSTLTNTFTATGLIIVVSCALEIEKQLDQQMLMRNYRGFLNKK